MARQRKMTPERRVFINSLLEHYKSSDANDVQEMLKDLLGDTLQGIPEAKMDEKLGYSKGPTLKASSNPVLYEKIKLIFLTLKIRFCQCIRKKCSQETYQRIFMIFTELMPQPRDFTYD